MTTFKCLSVSQPFAHLIVTGRKTIELRGWNTNFRGEILIHSPIKVRDEDCKRLHIDCGKLARGAIVGKAILYDVKRYETQRQWLDDAKYHMASKNFANKRYGFLLKKTKEFAIPIPQKGRLGLFDVTVNPAGIKDAHITTEIFDEEYRTQWINHH